VNPGVSVRIEGLPAVLAQLGKLKPAKLNAIARGGLKKAARMMVKAVKARLQPGGRGYETGALRKSIGFKVGTAKDGHSYAVVGPQRAMKRVEFNKTTRKWRMEPTKFGLRLKGKQVGRDPANYAHLIEYGHRIGAHGSGTLKPIQKPGWTPELVWSKKLQTMVFKHGAPRRAAKSKVTGEAGQGKGEGFVFGIGFMRATFDATQAAAVEIVRNHMRDEIKRLVLKGKV